MEARQWWDIKSGHPFLRTQINNIAALLSEIFPGWVAAVISGKYQLSTSSCSESAGISLCLQYLSIRSYKVVINESNYWITSL